ncbi:MAG: hypothetical protein HS127_16755 [Planctomycetia bacterium]|nr:hypothetical protein [Planctomycetia bacterium]
MNYFVQLPFVLFHKTTRQLGHTDAPASLPYFILVGESIRYVAESQGQWLALIGWAAAALNVPFAISGLDGRHF